MAILTTAPVPAKFQMFFVSQEQYGWNETYWYAGQTADRQALRNLVIFFMEKRMACATQDTRARWCRIQSQFSRDPIIVDLDGIANSVGKITENVNNTANRVMVRLEATNVGYNRAFWGGVPDSMVSKDQFTPSPAWSNAFTAWSTQVATPNTFNVRASVDNPIPAVPVNVLSRGDPRGIVAVMPVGGSLVLGKSYRIKGATSIGYNGIKTVIKDPSTMGALTYLLGGARPQVDNSVTDHPTATLISPLSGNITNIFVENLVQRRAGRPFGLARGRKPTVLPLRR